MQWTVRNMHLQGGKKQNRNIRKQTDKHLCALYAEHNISTDASLSDLDSVCILPGESSVRQLVPVHDPGVTQDLQDTVAKIKAFLNLC